MIEKLAAFNPWTYPSPGVSQEEAAIILGEPLAEALTHPRPGRFISWMIDDADDPLYTTIKEKE